MMQTEVSLSERLCTKAPIIEFSTGDEVVLTWQAPGPRRPYQYLSQDTFVITDGEASEPSVEMTGNDLTQNFHCSVTGEPTLTYALVVRKTVVCYPEYGLVKHFRVVRAHVCSDADLNKVKDLIAAWHG